MGLGLVAGLVFGERVAFLKVFGDIFIALLQMTVLPYVFVSLIADVGQLKSSQAASLAKSANGAVAASTSRSMIFSSSRPSRLRIDASGLFGLGSTVTR